MCPKQTKQEEIPSVQLPRPRPREENRMCLFCGTPVEREIVDICSNDERLVGKSIDILQRTIDKTIKMSSNWPLAKPKMVVYVTLQSDENNKNEFLLSDDHNRYVMFPIKDRKGRVVGFGGRVMNPDDQPKYLNTGETPVFQKNRELYGFYEALEFRKDLKEIFVVEGYR